MERKLSEFNDTLFKKTGLRVPTTAIRKRIDHINRVDKAKSPNYLKVMKGESNKPYKLTEIEDKKIVGKFIHLHKKDPNFLYHCSVDEENKLRFIVSM